MPSDSYAGDVDKSRSQQINELADKFTRDPRRILDALAESQQACADETLIVILPIVQAQNAVFPAYEFRARWRLSYAKAEVSGGIAQLTSSPYFSASAETFAKLAGRGRILTWSSAALRDEVGKTHYGEVSPSVIAIDDAPRSSMAWRNFVSSAFEAGDYPLRPPRDWARFLLEGLAEFYQAAALELRQERFPWEALPSASNSFLSDVRDRAAAARHDPTEALRRALLA